MHAVLCSRHTVSPGGSIVKQGGACNATAACNHRIASMTDCARQKKQGCGVFKPSLCSSCADSSTQPACSCCQHPSDMSDGNAWRGAHCADTYMLVMVQVPCILLSEATARLWISIKLYWLLVAVAWCCMMIYPVSVGVLHQSHTPIPARAVD